MIITEIDKQRNMESSRYLAKKQLPKGLLVLKEIVTNVSQDNAFASAELKLEWIICCQWRYGF